MAWRSSDSAAHGTEPGPEGSLVGEAACSSTELWEVGSGVGFRVVECPVAHARSQPCAAVHWLVELGSLMDKAGSQAITADQCGAGVTMSLAWVPDRYGMVLLGTKCSHLWVRQAACGCPAGRG